MRRNYETAITVLEDMFILARQTPAYASVLYELLMTASLDMEGKIRIIINDEYEKEISKAEGVKSVKAVKDALVFLEESGYFTQPRTGIFYVSDFLLDGIMWRDAHNIEVFIGKDESGVRKISLVTKEAIPECHSSPVPTDKAGEGEHALQKKAPKTRKKRAKKEGTPEEVAEVEAEANNEQDYDGSNHDDMPPDEILNDETMYSFEQENEEDVNRPFWQDANGNLAPEYGDPSTPTEFCSPEVQAFRAKIINSEHFEKCIANNDQ